MWYDFLLAGFNIGAGLVFLVKGSTPLTGYIQVLFGIGLLISGFLNRS